MKSIIRLYSWESLIEQLISYNEALSYYKASKELNTATNIECFTGVTSKVAEELEEVPVISSTALSLRLLIEIISAEPPKGNKKLSVADLDLILAIASLLINWSMLSDNIHNEIVNHELSILESGRIGINKEAFDEVYKPFMKNKILEHLEYSISSFKRNSSLIIQGETNIDISMYEEAFEEEFGLSLLEIVNFYNFLTDFGFELEVAAPSLNLSDLKLKLKEILKWDYKTIDRAIKLFSLFPRKRWEIPPNGFEHNDIWPWRYNRRLSYLRRPLIIGPIVDDNSLVFWGPRHVEEAFENFVVPL